MKIKLAQRSTLGAEICLVFFEDGDFGLLLGESTADKEVICKAKLNTEGNLLIIEYENRKAIVPITVGKWREGEKYYLNIAVEGRESINLVEELRKIFGYYNTEELED